ncbi:hypothetical protein D6D26_09790 [Aureobasidium pullulans]|nr:hypothetical protein D6D26_09790 [Aureobasidium pullulans]
MSIMGFFKHLRAKSHNKSNESSSNSPRRSPIAIRPGRDFAAKLPNDILTKIMVQVAPHTQDATFEPSERSTIGEGCMLCDLRDLAKAGQVCRRWYNAAATVFSVRIDAVHYCELEEILAERRQKKTFLKAPIESGDVPTIRLALFSRTVRENPNLAHGVTMLKLPYMTRETAKADLARTVSVLPNLKYVDLPDGAFTGDPNCMPLVHELQARCPDIRKMSYRQGSEGSFEQLARRSWQSLEIIEISGIHVEPSTLRIVLGSLPALRELTMTDLPWLDDTIFYQSPMLPDFPALHTLALENTPRITAEGMVVYFDKPLNRNTLKDLSLDGTGIDPIELYRFLFDASALHSLSIVETVSKSLALSLNDLPPLESISLKVLHFELTDSEDAHGLQKPAASYYAYLAQSLHANGLPALSQLYVRDPDFAEIMLLPAPPTPFMDGGGNQRQSVVGAMNPPRGLHQPLEVFSKGLDELEWAFTAYQPPAASQGRHGSGSSGRPLSSYSAARGLGPQWAQGGFGGDARKSVIVGNGYGGFLAVPQEEAARPRSSAGHESRSWGSNSSPGNGGGALAALAPMGTSVGSSASGIGSRGSWLKPPPKIPGSEGHGHKRAGSRQDLWR